MKYLTILIFFISFQVAGQEFFSKCYNSCGVYDLQLFGFDDIVFDSSQKYSYILFSIPGKTHLCKIDSVGNNIVLKEFNNAPDTVQISADTLATTQVVPLRLLHIHDNLILLISLKDSSVVTTSATTVFSMLLISFYDSSLNKINDKSYLLPYNIYFPNNLPLHENPIMISLKADHSGFIIAAPFGGFNSTSSSSIMVASFDTTGNLLQVVNYYEPGKDLSLCDYKMAINKSFILIRSDSSMGVLAIDSSLNIINAVKYDSPGDFWLPQILNVSGTNRISLIATRGQDLPALVVGTDSTLNLVNSKLLLADSIYSITNVTGRNSRGLMVINLKKYRTVDSSFGQDVVFIDSMNQITNTHMRASDYHGPQGDYFALSSFGKIVERNIGYESLSIDGSFDHHFGDHYDVILSQLGHNTEKCYDYDSAASSYFLGNYNLVDSSIFVLDSLISLSTINSSLDFDPSPNIFNYLLCSGLIDEIKLTANDDDSFVLYPNPINHFLTINNDRYTISNIEIFNSFGQRIYFRNEDCERCVVDFEKFPTGIYFIRAFSGNKIFNGKVIKE